MTPEVSITSSASPFGNIALCLSGGGYRAATFGLGTIDMLDELGYLKDVKLLSTVSGGTFTGVSYALSLSEGKSYKDFYDGLFTFLKDTNCIDIALDGLQKSSPSPSGAKNLSLIRSAATLYDQKLFHGAKFEKLRQVVGNDKRFLELIFNATEFRRGNSFRFRASHSSRVKSGNGDLLVNTDIANGIRLADIVAASSCFPGAFEPIRFPEDFVWPNGIKETQAKLLDSAECWTSTDEKTKGECISVPLMDGGIYDNQGISNAQQADSDAKIFGLYVISDTTTRNHEMLDYPSPDNKSGVFTLGIWFWIVAFVYLLTLVSTGVLVGQVIMNLGKYHWAQAFFQFAVPIIVLFLITWGLGALYEVFRTNKKIEIMGQEFSLWKVLKRIRPIQTYQIGKSRVDSLVTLSSNVFMKRIRDLQNQKLMLDDKYRGKVAFDVIYTIFDESEESKYFGYDAALRPTLEMRELSEKAEQVKTALWYENKDVQDLLIVTAHFTTCFALLKHLWRRYDFEKKTAEESCPPVAPPPRPDDRSSSYYEAYMHIRKKWELLKEDPKRYLNRDRSGS